VIDAKTFEEKTGHKPQDDDLERSNCKEAGVLGHTFCGWCDDCEKPVFMCGHMKDRKDKNKTISGDVE
jgi:hypothetical protein